MVGISYLEAPVFQVLYQSKLVLTAVISVIILKRSYRLIQWICIVAVSLGVAIVMDGLRAGSTDLKSISRKGFGAVVIAGLASSLATVYFEKVIKASRNPSGSSDTTSITNEGSAESNSVDHGQHVHGPASLWMRTMQLSFFSVVIVIIKDSFGLFHYYSDSPVPSYFHGFTLWVWVLVILQALGGVLVSAVIKVSLLVISPERTILV